MKLFVALFFICAIITMVVVPSYEQCAKACPYNYAPVCGRSANGQTQVFGNQCALDVEICKNPDAGWQLLKQGPC